MKNKLIKAVRTIADFDLNLFNELNLGLELQDFTEPCLTDSEIYSLLNEYEKKLPYLKGIKSMHGSFIDLNIASFNRDIAAYSRKMYKRDLFFAKLLNLDFIIFHTQIMPWFKEDFKFDLFLKSNAEFFNEAVENSGFKGCVVLENVCEKDSRLSAKLIEAAASPQVKLNLDWGHALVSGEKLENWFSNNQKHIAYMHLHSNDGKSDLHNPVSKEDFTKLSKLLEKYRLNCPICLEYWDIDIKKEMERIALF